jgi:hypothetical protein
MTWAAQKAESWVMGSQRVDQLMPGGIEWDSSWCMYIRWVRGVKTVVYNALYKV